MAMMTSKPGAETADINVTPLIDVLLVLLIIFMVITPLTPRGLEALVPQSNERRPESRDQEQTVVLQVLDGNSDRPVLRINQENIGWSDVGPRLKEIYKARGEKVLFVRGDADIPFEDVARAIDIAHSAGVDKVGLVTARLEAGG